MTGLWGKRKELIQSGLTAPGQVVKVPLKGVVKCAKVGDLKRKILFIFYNLFKGPGQAVPVRLSE
jgi:hypothetical protein